MTRAWSSERRSLGARVTGSSDLAVCESLSLNEERPLRVPFLGRGNVWLDCAQEEQAVYLARCLIKEALEKTAPGQLRIVGFDSDLSGVFAPFAGLSAGGVYQLRLIADEGELANRLAETRQQIQAVQNLMQGRTRSLSEFRRLVGRPVEGYQLIVLFMNMGLVSNELRMCISKLMKSGPMAGVSFLIVSTTLMTVSDGETELVVEVEDLAPNVTVLEVKGERVVAVGGSLETACPRLSPTSFLEASEAVVRRLATSPLPMVRFDELHDLTCSWTDETTGGVSFTVGKYGLADVEITLGANASQRHNALITGAVGQGKSNLISMIIHSMCLRYPPSELRLYLLDYKEGGHVQGLLEQGEGRLPAACGHPGSRERRVLWDRGARGASRRVQEAHVDHEGDRCPKHPGAQAA